jgi:hypothetical protein
MKNVQETTVVPCDIETFWNTFLDERYMRALFTEVLAFKEFSILELTTSGRKILTVPRMNLPAVIEKLVGDRFAYEEHGTLDRATNLWSWRVTQPAKDASGKPRKELVSTSGTIRLEPTGEGLCRRINLASIEGRVFGLGGAIEAAAEKEIRSAWAKESAFLGQWLQKRPTSR